MDVIGNVIASVVISKMHTKSEQIESKSSLKILENKIYSLIDAVLFNISASYRDARAKFASQYMVFRANNEIKNMIPMSDLKKAFGNLDVEEFAENNPEIEKKDQDPEKLEGLNHYLAESAEALAPSILAYQDKTEFAKNLEEAFGEMDVEELAEINPEIKVLNQYLAESAEALAPFILAYQDQDEFAKNLNEEFGEMDVERLNKAKSKIEEKAEDYIMYRRYLDVGFGDIDIKGLAKDNSKIEMKAAQYEREKLLSLCKSEEFKRNLVENPGAFVGFITFLQFYANDIYQVLMATLWDETNGLFLPEWSID
jgi:Holliday junction resolvase-like predicted endonuclease